MNIEKAEFTVVPSCPVNDVQFGVQTHPKNQSWDGNTQDEGDHDSDMKILWTDEVGMYPRRRLQSGTIEYIMNLFWRCHC